ncbi:MAG: DUF1223 domain-containing protein [Alphaproteobacteria bacterium]
MAFRRTIAALIAAVAITSVASGARSGEPGPVVVELFTSQGCSSCPPADQYLGELSGRGDVIALSFHVDYWNYMGWTDPFSRPEFTKRQRYYREALGLRYVYTPQMVVDGRTEGIGSDRTAIEHQIREAAARPRVPVTMAMEAGTLTVNLPAVADAPLAMIWFVVFDRQHRTKVGRGENAGRSIANAHVVRQIVAIGTWAGDAKRLTYMPEGMTRDQGCAVILQTEKQGPILGAAMIRPPTS